MTQRKTNFTGLHRRRATDLAVYITNLLLVAIAVVPLFLIIGSILIKGIGQINLAFFTERVPTISQAKAAHNAVLEGERVLLPGGIANGIIGTLVMVVLSSIIAIPIGIYGGVYLAEEHNTRFARAIRFITDLLQGTPSVVIGIVVYAVVVIPMRTYSGFAGAVSLAIMMIPLIIRSTEETMLRLPRSMKESALALGASYRSTMNKVLLPSARSGIFTGILLAVSRVMGETAPLMMTALASRWINWNPFEPMSAVPLLIWQFYNNPFLQEMIWSSALFLLVLVLSFNIIAKTIAAKSEIK